MDTDQVYDDDQPLELPEPVVEDLEAEWAALGCDCDCDWEWR